MSCGILLNFLTKSITNSEKVHITSTNYTHSRLWSVLQMELSNSAKIELLHASIHSLEQVGVLVQLTNFDGIDD